MTFTLTHDDDDNLWRAQLAGPDGPIATSAAAWTCDADIHYELLQVATGRAQAAAPDADGYCRVIAEPDGTGGWAFTVVQRRDDHDIPLLLSASQWPTRERAHAMGTAALGMWYDEATRHVPSRWLAPKAS